MVNWVACTQKIDTYLFFLILGSQGVFGTLTEDSSLKVRPFSMFASVRKLLTLNLRDDSKCRSIANIGNNNNPVTVGPAINQHYGATKSLAYYCGKF